MKVQQFFLKFAWANNDGVISACKINVKFSNALSASHCPNLISAVLVDMEFLGFLMRQGSF